MLVPDAVLHLFIAPQRGAPTVAVDQVEAVAGCGLRGDRYFIERNRRAPDGHVTLIEAEQVDGFNTSFRTALGYDAPRRNIVTRGVALNDLLGTHFLVGPCLLAAVELCEPCAAFMRRTHPATLRHFANRGGLRCRILEGGVIRVGDALRGSLP